MEVASSRPGEPADAQPILVCLTCLDWFTAEADSELNARMFGTPAVLGAEIPPDVIRRMAEAYSER